MNKILVLFPNTWDKAEFSKEKYKEKYQFIYFGPKLFEFPLVLKISQSYKLPFFNSCKFIKQVIKKMKDEQIDAVISSDEYIGAIIAAAVSKELGLPGNDPAQMILVQHKFHSRIAQLEYCPSAAVNCQLIPAKLSKEFIPKLHYPFFVKPAKGTFSLYAKKIDNRKGLNAHMAFSWIEQTILKALNRPYNQLLRKYTTLTKDANYFVAEELIEGEQVTLDGYVHNNKVEICGVVDSVMYPGTNVFERFQYPSKHSDEVCERMTNLAKNLMKDIGFNNGQFNVEFFYNEKEDKISIIEINSRLSYQFGELYENVDGVNTYQILLDLALGETPEFIEKKGDFKCSASFVIRAFEGTELQSVPQKEHILSFCERYPESSVKVFGKAGTKFSSELRSVGGYRCGIINLGAHSSQDLFSRYKDAVVSLPFSYS